MKKKVLVVGTGAMGQAILRYCFPNFKERLEPAAAVDVNAAALEASGDLLGLPSQSRFASAEEAFRTVDADFCLIATTPAFHREAALLAAGRKMPILCEKPIADTWEACVDIFKASRDAGIKMQVIQNYRNTARILTFKKALQEGRIGKLHYLNGRYLQDARKRGAWGSNRHEIQHPMLIEASIHHFDQLRNLAGADCASIGGFEWRPEQDSFDGAPCGLFTMRFTNDARGVYEGNGIAGGRENSWFQEYYRAEGSEGALVADSDNVVRLYKNRPGEELLVEEIENEKPRFESHNAMIEQFLDWLDGGAEPATAIADNLKSAAMIFAAMQASETGCAVDVSAMVANALVK